MSKKLKGFSLAELLIALLVISIVLSAAIPTLTKKSSQDREQIWKWSHDNNSAYFGLGANQSVLIGTPNAPMDTSDDAENPISLAVMMTDDKGSSSTEIEYNGPRFTTDGDKLMILKKSLQGSNTTNMANSHISFYNIENSETASTDRMTYGGRIAVDKHNLAFGRATLLHMNDIDEQGSYEDSFYGENTAIGHFALMNTRDGSKNVAIGEKTLTLNKSGFHNTALGYLAGNKVGHRERENQRTIGLLSSIASYAKQLVLEKVNDYSEESSDNTILGSFALSQNEFGFGNTVVGSQSLLEQYIGDENTVLGYYSMGKMENGFGNTSIGANACQYLKEGNYNICIGNAVVPDTLGSNTYNFGLAIGSTRTPQDGIDYKASIQNSVPLITGHMQRVGTDSSIAGGIATTTFKSNPSVTDNQNGYFDKELIVNAKEVEFKPFHGGNIPTFVFTSVPGDINHENQTGYGINNNFKDAGGVSGSAYFNLRYFGPKSGSVAMQIKALENKAIIATFDPATVGEEVARFQDLSFNELIKFNMPKIQDDKSWRAGWRTQPTGEDDSSFINKGLRNNLRNNMVGIVADPNKITAATADADIFINNRMNIARRASHIINVDEKGTQIIDIDQKMPFEVNINGDANKPNLSVGNDNISLNANTNIEFKIADSPILHMNDSGITAKSELYIDTLNFPTTSPKSVKFALEYLNQKITDVANQLTGSDARLKNISGDNTAGLAEINKLEVKNYTYKNDKKKTPHVGVIAQQLQKIFPNSVFKGEDGYLKIRTEEIFYAMVNSIKELFAKLQDLTAKVVGLDKRITELEAQNKMLLEQNKAFEKRLEKLEKQAAK